MSGLSIKITADTASAIQQFNSLADSTETLGDKIAKANEKFGSEHIARFVDRQKLAQAAVTAAQGSTEALTRSAGAYQREIERLIKQGLSPESEQIKRLQSEYAGLQKQLKAVSGAHEDHAKSAEKSARALASGANAIAIYKFIKDSIEKIGGAFLGAAANVEDMTAAFTPMLGSADKAAALVKRINTEAATTPFEIESISNSVKRLMPAFQGSAEKAVQAFRMIGDTAGGNAGKLDTITNAYTKVMLTGKVGMEALNSIAGAGVPIFTELAESMGVTVTELSDMSSKGKITADDLTGAFQRMTGEGGIFFKGMETSSDTFNMRVLGLKENIGILAGTIGEKLLPMAKETVGNAAAAAEGLLKWAQEGENVERALSGLGAVAAAAAAGVTMFAVASQGHAAVTAMAGAAKLLMGALTGPAGIAALAVGALVGGIGLLINHAQEAGRQFREQSEAVRRNAAEAGALLDAYGGLNPSKTLDKNTTEALIKLYPELTDKIRENITTVEEAARITKEHASNKAAETEMEGPFCKDLRNKQNALAAYIKSLNDLAADERTALEGMAEAGRIIADPASTKSQIRNAESGMEIFRGQLGIVRAAITQETAEQNKLYEQITSGYAEMNKRLAEFGVGINTQGLVYKVEISTDVKQAEEEAGRAAAAMTKTFVEKVKETVMSQGQVLGEQINQIKSFIAQRAELEQAAGTSRIAAIKNVEKQILDSETYTAEERAIIAKAAAKAMEEAQKGGGGGAAPKPEKEDTRYKDMMEQMRTAIAETGKSERELAEMRAFAADATDEQTEAYMRMYDHLQRLKDAAEYEKKRVKDTEEIKNQTQGYLEKLEELRIKNDEIKNDEAQLLEMRRAAAIASIQASLADDEAKALAIERLNQYYNIMAKNAGQEFRADNFQAAMADQLAAAKGNMKGRIDILRDGLAELETLDVGSAEKRKEIEHDLTEKLKAEEESWKQVKINTALQALSAVQELTNVFGDIAQQQADERYAREAERLEERKNDNSKALIDQFNEEVGAEGLTDEAKEKMKKEFLEKYKQNETDYTEALEKEEEKRKNAAREAAIADKVIQAATAGINSMVAFTGVLAAWSTLNPILAAVQAGAILAAGLAQQAKIIATPISAETGGRFMVPDTGGGVDSAYMRVNAGEEALITPRGEGGGTVTHIILQIEKRTIFDVVNDGIRSGEIRPAANL